MHTQLTHIRLLAFIVAFKRIRRNSILYRHERKYIIAQRLGMSAVTVGKYMAECERLGLLVSHHKDRKFIKLSTAITILFPHENFRAFKHVRFFKGETPCTDHKTLTEKIKFALAKANFQRQAFQIRRKSIIDHPGTNRITVKRYKALKALAKREGCEVEDLSRMCRKTDSVITGKNHLSNIIGCCATTAAKLLRKWHNQGIITRKIAVTIIHAPVNTATYDCFIAAGCRYLRPLPDRQGYYNVLGSEITIENMEIH